MKYVDALILCGGRGTRLRSVIADKPKVLAPVNGRPFLSYLFEQLIVVGFKKVILCTGYKGEMVNDTFGNRYRNLTIRYSQEPEALGTGGALRYALPMIEKETILAMNGDSFCKTDFKKLFKFHNSRKGMASIVLARSQYGTDYGVVKLNKSNRIISFSEKVDCQRDRYINAGIYLMNRDMLNHMPDKEQFSLEYDVFPRMMKLDCFGFVSDGELIDIGTQERLKRAQKYFSINS